MTVREIIIDGQSVPRRRFTVWAWLYFLAYVALPVLTGAAILDYALYIFFFS